LLIHAGEIWFRFLIFFGFGFIMVYTGVTGIINPREILPHGKFSLENIYLPRQYYRGKISLANIDPPVKFFLYSSDFLITEVIFITIYVWCVNNNYLLYCFKQIMSFKCIGINNLLININKKVRLYRCSVWKPLSPNPNNTQFVHNNFFQLIKWSHWNRIIMCCLTHITQSG